MGALGDHLKSAISFLDKQDQDQFEEFKSYLNKFGDLEKALSDLNLGENVLNAIIGETWRLISNKDLSAYEGFICSGIQCPLSKLLSHLLTTAGKKASIITTNYDRLVEYAASMAGAFINTGYIQNYFGQFGINPQVGKAIGLKGYSGEVNVWKVHGSLDWFKVNGDSDVHLPLRQTIPRGHEPSIVTPGLSKYAKTHLEPYRSIFTQADKEIEAANGYLCVGYGFNDMHVQPKIITQIKREKPILLITYKLTDNAKKLIMGNGCKQYALIEAADDSNDTRIYSSGLGELTIKNESYWQLDKFLTLIKS
jgi:hypothetical protein